MKQILQFFLLLMLFSCNKIGVSEAEAKAVDVVLNYYGGMINRSVGMKTANAKRTDFFELDISKSDLLNKDQKDITYHAANIAYLFYSNLKKEKSNYDEVRVIISLENGEKNEYKFPVSELNEIMRFYPEITKTNDFINYEDYTSLRNQFSEKVRPTESELKELFEKLYTKFGSIKQIQNQGCTFEKDHVVGNIIVVKEVVILDRKTVQLFLTYDRKTKKLLGINFP